MRIVLEIEQYGRSQVEYKVFDQAKITIGRGFNNDVILHDPFINPHHATLTAQEGFWLCIDGLTLNGTFVGRHGDHEHKVKITAPVALHPGDVVVIGKTIIRVYDRSYPVGPPKAIDTFIHLPVRRDTAIRLFSVLAAFYLVFYLFQLFSSKRLDIFVMQFLTKETVLLVGIIVWAGIWALVTRLIKHRHVFMEHFLLASQWCVLVLVTSFLLQYVYFFVCNYTFHFVGALIFVIVAISIILNGHLAMSTHMSTFRRRVIVSIIAITMTGLPVLVNLAGRGEFNPDPKHYVNIPYVPKQLIPTIAIDQEIKRIDSIFEQ